MAIFSHNGKVLHLLDELRVISFRITEPVNEPGDIELNLQIIVDSATMKFLREWEEKYRRRDLHFGYIYDFLFEGKIFKNCFILSWEISETSVQMKSTVVELQLQAQKVVTEEEAIEEQEHKLDKARQAISDFLKKLQ